MRTSSIENLEARKQEIENKLKLARKRENAKAEKRLGKLKLRLGEAVLHMVELEMVDDYYKVIHQISPVYRDETLALLREFSVFGDPPKKKEDGNLPDLGGGAF